VQGAPGGYGAGLQGFQSLDTVTAMMLAQQAQQAAAASESGLFAGPASRQHDAALLATLSADPAALSHLAAEIAAASAAGAGRDFGGLGGGGEAAAAGGSGGLWDYGRSARASGSFDRGSFDRPLTRDQAGGFGHHGAVGSGVPASLPRGPQGGGGRGRPESPSFWAACAARGGSGGIPTSYAARYHDQQQQQFTSYSDLGAGGFLAASGLEEPMGDAAAAMAPAGAADFVLDDTTGLPIPAAPGAEASEAELPYNSSAALLPDNLLG
jgi:hypothetical protein